MIGTEDGYWYSFKAQLQTGGDVEYTFHQFNQELVVGTCSSADDAFGNWKKLERP